MRDIQNPQLIEFSSLSISLTHSTDERRRQFKNDEMEDDIVKRNFLSFSSCVTKKKIIFFLVLLLLLTFFLYKFYLNFYIFFISLRNKPPLFFACFKNNSQIHSLRTFKSFTFDIIQNLNFFVIFVFFLCVKR